VFVVFAVVLATVCAAMEARPFLLIFLTTHFAVRRIWHLPESGASRRRSSAIATRTDWRVAGASSGRIPLPLWMSGMKLLTAATQDMRWSSALFKTVTDDQDS
jgi:hypothetical protein